MKKSSSSLAMAERRLPWGRAEVMGAWAAAIVVIIDKVGRWGGRLVGEAM